jgi:hypothetical protein
MGRVSNWRKRHRYWGGNSIRGNRPYHDKPVYRKDRLNYVAVPRAPNASERWRKRSVPRAPYRFEPHVVRRPYKNEPHLVRAPYRGEPHIIRPPNAAERASRSYLPRAPYKGE